MTCLNNICLQAKAKADAAADWEKLSKAEQEIYNALADGGQLKTLKQLSYKCDKGTPSSCKYFSIVHYNRKVKISLLIK